MKTCIARYQKRLLDYLCGCVMSRAWLLPYTRKSLSFSIDAEDGPEHVFGFGQWEGDGGHGAL